MNVVKVFLCGDVMTGRGIDQVMQHPGDPRLHEPYVDSAREYVEIAERASGPIPRRVAPGYVWGDALPELERARPHARIINLETAVTAAGEAWPGKGIHYRMHPANALCLTAAGIDCCVLANNHVLDWGYHGLEETLAALGSAGIRVAGAGENAAAAASPASIDLGGGLRLLVFAYGSASAGVPLAWAARRGRAGVNVLDEFSGDAAGRVARDVNARRPGDLVVASIHWGSNWGYEVTREQRALAHQLIDEAGVDVVHGHSSHHPRPIEVHAGKLVLYGCGDFLNDYEGIGGYESFRAGLVVMYLPELDAASGRLLRLELVPMRIRGFRLGRASGEEASWLESTLGREGKVFGTRLERRPDGTLELRWPA
jgi:poly-gamma-glutamate synthesis protein (capsule biosynthesis protein)